MAEQAVEQFRSQRAVIVEDFRPLLEGAVGGNDGGAALVALTDHLEQTVGGELVDREVSQFIDLYVAPHKPTQGSIPTQTASPNCSTPMTPYHSEATAAGLFPSQEMEDQFAAYLQWTKDQGLPRFAAIESIIDAGSAPGLQFPTPAMAQQFSAYMRWVAAEGLSPFYAFMATAPRLSEVREQGL